VYFLDAFCSLDFLIGFGPGKERLMVLHLKTYHLYFYFKALKTKAHGVSDEKRIGMSGWLTHFASGSRDGKASPAEQISARNGRA
jgi:hypothetical protein